MIPGAFGVGLLKSEGRIEYDTLAQLLQEGRVAARLSQRALAKRLGRTQSYEAKVENALQRIDFVETMDFAAAVGTTLTALSAELETRKAASSPADDQDQELPLR